MQCWNCGFENLPGLTACARCTSRLELSQIEFEPPRASRARLATRAARQWHGLRDVVRECRDWFRHISTLEEGPVPTSAVAWSLLPGGGQIREGYVTIGGFVVVSWAILGVLALLHLATQWQSLYVTLMIVLHTLAFFATLAPSLRHVSRVTRVLAPIALWCALNYVVYGAAGWLISRFVQPVPIALESVGGRTVRGDDGLLVEGYWLRPKEFRRGDLVLYEIPHIRRDQYDIRGGVLADRVLGLPGERVHLSGGKILIDGAPCPAAPLAALPLMETVDRLLGPDEYLIVPSEARLYYHNVDGLRADLAEAIVIVPRERVLGRVLWRIRPSGRWEAME